MIANVEKTLAIRCLVDFLQFLTLNINSLKMLSRYDHIEILTHLKFVPLMSVIFKNTTSMRL